MDVWEVLASVTELGIFPKTDEPPSGGKLVAKRQRRMQRLFLHFGDVGTGWILWEVLRYNNYENLIKIQFTYN